MRVLVSDTSVLIDLERGELIESAFGLSFQLAVPDVLYRRELEDHGGQRFLDLGLRVEELDPQGVQDAQDYRRTAAGLSVADSFALALAVREEWVLLTGDRQLRSLATTERVQCHGVLWLLDQMLSEGVAGQLLHDGLDAIAKHPRCRLPAREIRERLKGYSK